MNPYDLLTWISKAYKTSLDNEIQKIGNTREHLFQAWQSFHFDENTDTLHAYLTHIRQVAILLSYREPKILKICKNTLPTKLYWVLFPIDDLRQVVETTKKNTNERKGR